MARERNRQVVCIATTLRDAGPPLDSFLRYHRHLGVDRFYLYFDDPEDPDMRRVRGSEDVIAIPVDAELRERQLGASRLRDEVAPYVSEVGARQLLNVEAGLGRALDDGMGWLIHIDVDELLYTQGKSVQETLGAYAAEGAESIVFMNLEAVPEKTLIRDYFREVTLFKRNPAMLDEDARASLPSAFAGRPYFHSYVNGKPAVRVASDVIPAGPHRFGARGRRLPTAPAWEEFVLHYTNCGFAQYRQKYELRGAFPDDYLGRTPVIPFHRRSRELFAAGDIERANEHYRNAVMIDDRELIERLSKAGYLVRIEEPAELLRAGGRAQ